MLSRQKSYGVDEFGKGGYAWDVSFTTEGYPRHVGEQAALEPVYRPAGGGASEGDKRLPLLEGLEPEVAVEEIVPGYGPKVFVEVNSGTQLRA